tara:strand:- start:147 stop:782 length:636 start_codon:yes stop_codon:yes gene_type:complete
MQNEKVSIIDYGLGNIESLKNAIKKIGYIPDLYSTNSIINSNIAIIPGVGSFNYAMKLIISKNIDKEINKFVSKENNFLIGICLGMQLLFESSTEIDLSIGLGLIKGKVDKLTFESSKKLPNVGWKETFILRRNNFEYLNKYNKKNFYYVHSFKCIPKNRLDGFGYSNFKNEQFASIVTNGSNIIGTQFHPEKSGEIGLSFLKDIINNNIL